MDASTALPGRLHQAIATDSARTGRRRGLRRAGLLALLLSAPVLPLLGSPTGAAERLYRHVGPDGSVTFSDIPASQIGGGYRSYRGSYGRPAAVLSCIGLSSAAIDARAIDYRADFEAAAARRNLDPLLLQAVARVESCFDRKAVSSVGAQGLMQLMPATARELGVADSFVAAGNIAGGARYLAQMLQRFGGDLSLALAAYNAGPGAVERHGGIPPFAETQRYVAKVLATHERYRLDGASAP